MRVRAAGSMLVLLPLAAACGADAGEGAGDARPTAWPAGTAVAVGDVAIPATEIERVAEWIAVAQPSAARTHCRRVALTGLVLPRAALRAALPRPRAEALASCRARRAELTGEVETVGPPTPGTVVTGAWRELGIAVWGHMRDSPLETWSEPIEDVGRFTLARRLAYKESPERLRLELVHFALEPQDGIAIDLDAVLESQHLTIVDPAWRDAVPAAWRVRMRGGPEHGDPPNGDPPRGETP